MFLRGLLIRACTIIGSITVRKITQIISRDGDNDEHIAGYRVFHSRNRGGAAGLFRLAAFDLEE